MTANIGVIIGPMLGGLTSDPVATYPSLFGGVKWLERYPYSPPNILSAVILAAAFVFVWFGMEEVSFLIQVAFGVLLTAVDTRAFQSPRGLWNQAQSTAYGFVQEGSRQESRTRTRIHAYWR